MAAVEKAPDAFRTISEVAQELDVPQHVLRFWESRFREIRPMKRGGGRRYYRPDDVDLLRGIRHLLYGEGYTIRGVQRLLREQGQRFVQNVWQPGAPQPTLKPADDAPDEPAGLAERFAEAAPAASRPPPGLSGDDRQKLQATLRDLGECRRLLDAALNERS
jgi:DNA-binding transcriptional MerR regulator